MWKLLNIKTKVEVYNSHTWLSPHNRSATLKYSCISMWFGAHLMCAAVCVCVFPSVRDRGRKVWSPVPQPVNNYHRWLKGGQWKERKKKQEEDKKDKTRQKKKKKMKQGEIIRAASVDESPISPTHPPSGYRGNPDKDVSSLVLLTGLCIGSDRAWIPITPAWHRLHWRRRQK